MNRQERNQAKAELAELLRRRASNGQKDLDQSQRKAAKRIERYEKFPDSREDHNIQEFETTGIERSALLYEMAEKVERGAQLSAAELDRLTGPEAVLLNRLAEG